MQEAPADPVPDIVLAPLLQAEARAAKAELDRRQADALRSKEHYRKLLEEQMAAKKQLELLKKQREHHIVAEQLDSLEGDDRMMAEIAKLLKVRVPAHPYVWKPRPGAPSVSAAGPGCVSRGSEARDG